MDEISERISGFIESVGRKVTWDQNQKRAECSGSSYVTGNGQVAEEGSGRLKGEVSAQIPVHEGCEGLWERNKKRKWKRWVGL